MKHRDIKISNENSDVCSQKNCNNQSKRSLPRKRAEKSGIFDFQGYSRKVNICSDCYRRYKKATKKDRSLESLGR